MDFPSSKNNFDKDLIDAKKYELFALEYFHKIKHYNIVENRKNEDLKFFDLIVYDDNNNVLCFIEVKHDKYVAMNNHFAVEYESWKKPSGIVITKAEYFIFISSLPKSTQHIMYIFKTKELRKFIKNNRGKLDAKTCLIIQPCIVQNETNAKFFRIHLDYLVGLYQKIDVTKYVDNGLLTNPDL
jgi:hypothetical protein